MPFSRPCVPVTRRAVVGCRRPVGSTVVFEQSTLSLAAPAGDGASSLVWGSSKDRPSTACSLRLFLPASFLPLSLHTCRSHSGLSVSGLLLPFLPVSFKGIHPSKSISPLILSWHLLLFRPELKPQRQHQEIPLRTLGETSSEHSWSPWFLLG